MADPVNAHASPYTVLDGTYQSLSAGTLLSMSDADSNCTDWSATSDNNQCSFKLTVTTGCTVT